MMSISNFKTLIAVAVTNGTTSLMDFFCLYNLINEYRNGKRGLININLNFFKYTFR